MFFHFRNPVQLDGIFFCSVGGIYRKKTMVFATLFELKRHLNIETNYVDDDPYLQDLLAVSSLSIETYCNGGLSEYTEDNFPKTLKQACLLLSAHWYLNRQIVSYAKGEEIPYSFQFLVNPYKNILIQ